MATLFLSLSFLDKFVPHSFNPLHHKLLVICRKLKIYTSHWWKIRNLTFIISNINLHHYYINQVPRFFKIAKWYAKFVASLIFIKRCCLYFFFILCLFFLKVKAKGLLVFDHWTHCINTELHELNLLFTPISNNCKKKVNNKDFNQP